MLTQYKFLKSRVSAGHRDMHMSGESFIHISQFRQHISTPDLLNVELDVLLLSGQWRARLLDSVGEGSRVVSGSNTRSYSQNIITLISIVASTQTFQFSFNNKFSILDLNDFAIIDNSDIGSF